MAYLGSPAMPVCHCGKPGLFQDVLGTHCAGHWQARNDDLGSIRYENGIAFGWDENRPDPTRNFS